MQLQLRAWLAQKPSGSRSSALVQTVAASAASGMSLLRECRRGRKADVSRTETDWMDLIAHEGKATTAEEARGLVAQQSTKPVVAAESVARPCISGGRRRR